MRNVRCQALKSISLRGFLGGLARKIFSVTTVLSLTEVLTYARSNGNEEMEAQYRSLFQAVRLLPVSAETALLAVDLRARYGLATSDAIQLAAALEAGCQAFLTIDAGDFLRASGAIRVIVPSKLTG